MEPIYNAINLLNAVYSTMDGIAVTGIENQDKFVGCANAVKDVGQKLTEYVQNSKAEEAAKREEEVNG